LYLQQERSEKLKKYIKKQNKTKQNKTKQKTRNFLLEVKEGVVEINKLRNNRIL
jgi:hypothetical protein